MNRYQKQLNKQQHEGLYRHARMIPTGCIDFSGNDYLGLRQHPALIQAMVTATECYGTGTGSSRLISGTLDLHEQLEETLCRFHQREAALVFNSGYQANVTLMQALVGPDDWVFCDRLCHASLLDGIRMSGARLVRYRHLDLNHLEHKLQKAPASAVKWVVTESLFSMDGTLPNLKDWVSIAEMYKAYSLVDEAHAVGLYGDNHHSGRVEAAGLQDRITLVMGTFSKALGSFGAYITGDRLWRDYCINHARGFIYSTSLPSGPRWSCF